MRFSSHLIEAANEFRAKYLDSNDFDDKTVLDDNWTIVKVKLILNQLSSCF